MSTRVRTIPSPVLDGAITAFVGDQRIEVEAGSYAALPKDVPHGLSVRGEEARLLVTHGGNSYYRDDIDRANALVAKGIHYLDVGTSGGIHGLERGFCLMIGGEPEPARRLDPIFARTTHRRQPPRASRTRPRLIAMPREGQPQTDYRDDLRSRPPAPIGWAGRRPALDHRIRGAP